MTSQEHATPHNRGREGEGAPYWLGARFLLMVVLGSLPWTPCRAEVEDLERRTTWQQPREEELHRQLQEFLDGSVATAAAREQAEIKWEAEGNQSDGSSLLNGLAEAFAEVDERVQAVRSVCVAPQVASVPPTFQWLFEADIDPFLSSNVRLLYGRWLTQHAFYDEALEYLAGLHLADVADPAGLLFYRSVVHHRLLNKEQCLKDLSQLLENEAAVPTRFSALGRLMEADLRPLKEDSLDEVARLMEDIERRLHFGRAGTRVRQEGDDVIAKLDKMIKEIEEQQQQQQQAAGTNSPGNQPGNPAEQSGNLPGKGPGDVDQRSIGDQSGWGNLPPKQRQQALQQISKELPSHFREVIEEYFRKLARETE